MALDSHELEAAGVALVEQQLRELVKHDQQPAAAVQLTTVEYLYAQRIDR